MASSAVKAPREPSFTWMQTYVMGGIRRSAELTLRARGHAQPVADGKLDVLAVNRGRASNNREKLPFLTFDNLEKLVFPSFDNREKFYIAL